MLCFCMPHIANHTHKKSPVFYLFEAVFMKRTPVFSGKGFAFHILCELSQEYIFNKAKILRKCFLFIFLGHLFLCSPHWVHHQTELFLCHFSSCCFHVPADYKSSSTKPLFHTEHISSSATNWNSHMVFISKPCTHFVSWKHFFLFPVCQVGCNKVYTSTSDVMTHENFHKKNAQLINDGFQRFRATEDCGTVGCQFYGQKTTHFHCRYDGCSNSI